MAPKAFSSESAPPEQLTLDLQPAKQDRSAIEQQYFDELAENRRDLEDLALPGDPNRDFHHDDFSGPYEPKATVDYVAPPSDKRADTLASSQELNGLAPVAPGDKAKPFDSDKMLMNVLNGVASARKADGLSRLSEGNPAVKRLAARRGVSPRDVIEDAATTAIDRSNEARAEYERLARVAEAVVNILPIAPNAEPAKAPTMDEFVRSHFGTPRANRRNATLRRRIDSRKK